MKAKQATNRALSVARVIAGCIALLWLVLAIAPIVMTIMQVRDASPGVDQNAGGAVVFSLFFLAPVWAFAITGWLFLIPLVLGIIGARKAQWKITKLEYLNPLGFSALFVLVALVLSPNLGTILPYYLHWFFS